MQSCASFTVQGIYEAITHCQTLYPDPELSDSELDEWEGEEGGEEGEIDLEGGEFFTSAEGLNHLSPQGLATLSHLERILQPPSGSEVEEMLSNGDGKWMASCVFHNYIVVTCCHLYHCSLLWLCRLTHSC